MICPYCGADIDDNAATCPYCGSAFEKGQEQKYMQDLEEVRKDTEELTDITPREYKSSLRRHTRLIVIIAVIVAAVIAGAVISSKVSDNINNAEYKREIKNEMAFQDKYFGELNELYESGDDDACYARIQELMNEKGSSALWKWEHYDYFSYYEADYELRDIRMWIDEGTADDGTYASGIYTSLNILYGDLSEKKITGLNDKRKQFIEDVKADARTFLEEEIGLTPEEQDKLAEEYVEYGFADYDKIKKMVPEIIKNRDSKK